jgi:hypothetical protein
MRALKVLVVVMGLMIVAGVTVIGVVLVQRVSGPATSGAAASVVLDEPTGTHITAVSALPDRLALILAGGGPDRVVVVDVRSGHVVARAGLAR